ncbi:kinesin-domain-containing protein [Lophium mytilinum]|uniref:Kinesin-like protein n=1 Tax=Lophium mytilinum TaxID=390894 RepID=A0A6A6R4M9_9PEZI|nr:kinesin-domain-containing protein [Lophium mytilinum]
MATTLPRPSRPSLNPPTGPLPSLPVPKSRKSSVGSINESSVPSRRGSGASLLPSTTRALSSSALPQRPPRAQSSSTSNVPTLTANDSPHMLPPGKGLRKTISIGAFPQPPKYVGRNSSHPPSPLSTSSTPAGASLDQRVSAGPKAVPSRDSSLRMKSPRLSSRGGGLKSPLTPPSLAGESRTAPGNTMLTLPSPPQSRNSSAQDSYATSFEDINEEEPRGRADNKSGTDRHSTHKEGKGNVIVSVRVRPDASINDGKHDEWEVNAKKSSVAYRGREGGDYVYDNVFDTQDNNARVYDAAAKRLVRRVMEGYHGTVFAYGMTGTGKTFSMQGTATSPGVIPLAITDIFSFIRETPDREFLLRVSYLEIYNERIHDLLSLSTATAMNGTLLPQEEIKLREDSKRGVYATPLKEEIVQSPTQLLRVIARGDNARKVAGTQYNARSSRSHAVVQIVVESRERQPPGGTSLQDSKRSAIAPGGVRVSTLSLIDLAGSEKAAENKERRTEGSHINKSLLTLGTVIARLSTDKEKADAGKAGAKGDKHLPYRDSKLTRLLQGALSGNSLVSILCTIQIGSTGSVALANSHTGETINTLKFASRAKNNIVSHAKKAEDGLGERALLDRYRIEIQELRKQLEEKSAKESGEVVKEVIIREVLKEEEKEKDEEEEKAREIEAEQRHEEQMLEMQLARTALKERIEHLNRLILSSKSLGVNSGRSFSSMGLHNPTHNRGSILSNSDFRPVSARSSASHSALEVPAVNRTSSGGSGGSFPSPPIGTAVGETPSEEDDSLGENGDGTASQAAQIRALQADLSDKNRYIGTLEKRLLQARRSSQSRVSMSLSHKVIGGDEGVERLISEKDAEIADLRARLDDKDRMVTALRSAARKRDVADLGIDTSSTNESRRSSHQRSEGSTASSKFKGSPISPVALLSPASQKSGKGVDEMTRILDEMISERVDGAHGGAKGASRSSLRAVSEAK